MSKYSTMLLAVLASGSVSFAAVTNYVNSGSPDPDYLTGSYVSVPSGAAADISNISTLNVTGASISGGLSLDADVVSDASQIGGVGLNITNVDSVDIVNPVDDVNSIKGGDGGAITISGSATTAESTGGLGVSVVGGSSGTDSITITSALIEGGRAGDVLLTGSSIAFAKSYGGNAMKLDNASLTSGTVELRGGIGGNILSLGDSAESFGGSGLILEGDFSTSPFGDGFSALGGDAGTVTNQNGSAKSFGGDGVKYDYPFDSSFVGYPAVIDIDGGSFEGGDGDDVSFVSAATQGDYFKTFLEDNGSRGGHGLRITSRDQTPYNTTVMIDGGYFQGGDAGNATNLNDSGFVMARGGSGVFADYVSDLTINGGTFIGGSAGVANGEIGVSGAGLEVQDSITTINGGTFGGDIGLRVTSRFYGTDVPAFYVLKHNKTTINDGTFSNVEFIVTYDPTFFNDAQTIGINDIDINGGTFRDIRFTGDASPGIPESVNDARITAGTIESVTLDGTTSNSVVVTGGSIQTANMGGDANNRLDVSSGASLGTLNVTGSSKNYAKLTGAKVSKINFDSTGTTSADINDNGGALDSVDLIAGIADITFNQNHTISNMYVSSGVLTVNGSDLSISSGNTYELVDETAELNLAQNMTLNSGGSLKIGLGTLNVSSNFSASAESDLYTTYASDDAGGVKTGLIKVDGVAEFNTGLKWLLSNDGSVTNAADLLGGFVLAKSATNIVHDLDHKTDLDLVGNPDWWYGINGLTNEMVGSEYVLKATYGDRDLEEVLGNADPEFVKALVDLNKLLTDEQKALLRGLSEDQAAAVLEASYVRTPEMASALVGLQSVFADQIKDRTRSNLRFRNFGSRTTYSPMGAGGPDWYENMVEWTQNHLPGGSYDKDSTVDAPVPSGTSARPYKDMRGINGGTSKDSYNRLRASREGVSSKDGYNKLADNVNNATSGSPREKIDVPETYQVWGRGYMSTISQGSDSAFAGYDATVAGAIMGVDKRFHNMLLGVGAGYAKTMLDGNDSNDGDADTGHVVVYYAANGEAAYFDANINYAFNGVETTGNDALGYEGDYNAHTVGFYVGGGYGFSFMKDSLLFTPEVSMLSTLYTRDAYTETSSEGFPDKAYGSYDTQSYLSSVGATLSMIKKFESFRSEIMIQPELRVHWLHEFNADPDADSYAMIPGNEIAVALQAREEDLLKLGAGVRMAKWDNNTTEVGVDLDAALGENYDAVTLSAKILHRF